MDVFTSPIPQDLRFALSERIKSHQSKKDRVILIVPEQFTLQSEIWLLNCLDQDATIDIIVQSFSGLARTLLERLGVASGIDLKDASRRILVEKILIDQGKSQSQRGDRDKILETIAELRMEGISPEELRAIQNDFSQSPLTKEKIAWTADVLEAYEGALNQGLMDEQSRMEALADNIPQADWLSETHIILSDFQDLSNLEIRVLKALDDKAASLSFYVLAEETPSNQPVFFSSQVFLARLQAQVPHRRHALPRRVEIKEEWLRLAYGALSYQPIEARDQAAHTHILRALSIDQEVTGVAALIRRGVMEDGLRYKDFSLTVTNPAVYLPIIDRIFRQNEIPVFIDARRELLENPIARMIVQVLRIMEENFPLDALISVLQSDMLDINQEDVMAFESQALAHKIRWERLMRPESFEFDERQEHLSQKVYAKEADRALAAARVAQLVQELFQDYYQATRRKASVRKHAQALYAFISQDSLRHGLKAFQVACEASPEDGLAEENPQVLQSFVDLLDELVALLGEERMTFKNFSGLVRAGLEGMSIGIIPPAQDQVQVGALIRLRSEPKAVRMILGLSDLWMPSQAGDRTIFSDQEKSLLADRGIAFSSRQDRVSDQEALSFYATVLQAEKELILSYPLSDDSNGAMQPALLIGRSLGLFKEFDEVLLVNALEDLLLYVPPTARRQAMMKLREQPLVDGKEEKAWAQALGVYRHYQQNPGTTGRFLKAGLGYRKQRQALAPTLAEKLYPPGRLGVVSISEIETMRACPYRHFVRYGLKPEELRSFELEPKDFGSILHGALDRLTKEIQENGQVMNEREEELFARMDRYVVETAEEILSPKRLEDKRNQSIIRKVRRDARKAGRHIIRQLNEMAFQPIAREVDFGAGKELPPLILGLPQGTLRLEGRIDRIDGWHSHEGLRLSVIDYKTGFQEFDLTKAFDGIDAQLLLYLRTALEEEGSRPASLFYLSLKAPFIELDSEDQEKVVNAFVAELLLDGIVIDDEEVQKALGRGEKTRSQSVIRLRRSQGNILPEGLLYALMEHAQMRAEEAVADALEGDISVRPAQTKNWSACSFCDYTGLCQIEADDSFTRELVPVNWKELDQILGEEEEQ